MPLIYLTMIIMIIILNVKFSNCIIDMFVHQAYIIMENTFRKMGEVFDEIAQTEDQPPLVL